MELALHLGAHRTATTTLQRFAGARRGLLGKAGVGFWGPTQTRDGRMHPLIMAADRVTPALAQASAETSDALRQRIAALGMETLVISDENMLGAIGANLRARLLYGDAGGRLGRLYPAFGPSCRRIGLAIRSYERFWTSSLCYMMRKDRRGTSRADLAELAAQPRRWRDVIADIAAAMPDAEILVWRYEALADRPHETLALLAGVDAQQFPEMAVQSRHNASPDCAQLRAGLPLAARRSVRGSGPWMPFSPLARAHMRATYAEDIAWLNAGADGLARFIDPNNSKSPDHTVGHPGQTRGTDHDQRQRRVG